jgi:hypothetical protein
MTLSFLSACLKKMQFAWALKERPEIIKGQHFFLCAFVSLWLWYSFAAKQKKLIAGVLNLSCHTALSY